MAAKVQIKNEKYMPYGGIYFVIREFLLKMAPIIDGYLGLRSRLITYKGHDGYSPACAVLTSLGGDDVYVYRAILTNEWDMTEEEVISFYNQRGAKVVIVVARWTRGGRRDILTLYTSNNAYAALYANYT